MLKGTVGPPVVSTVTTGLRNRIINGDMRVNQRNVVSIIINSSRSFMADRFYSENDTGTGTITGQRLIFDSGQEINSLRLIALAPVTNLTGNAIVKGISQIIEDHNVRDLNGKKLTISFRIKTNWTGNLPIALGIRTFARSYVTDVPVISGENFVSATIELEDDSVATMNEGAGLRLFIGGNSEGNYRTSNVNAWTAGDYLASTSSTQWTKTTNNYIQITDVQLEAGSIATTFEHRSYGMELALCQRYYQRQSGASGNDRINGWFHETNRCKIIIYYYVPLRSSPSLGVDGFNVFEAVQASTSTGTGTGFGSFRLGTDASSFQLNGISPARTRFKQGTYLGTVAMNSEL